MKHHFFQSLSILGLASATAAACIGCTSDVVVLVRNPQTDAPMSNISVMLSTPSREPLDWYNHATSRSTDANGAAIFLDVVNTSHGMVRCGTWELNTSIPPPTRHGEWTATESSTLEFVVRPFHRVALRSVTPSE